MKLLLAFIMLGVIISDPAYAEFKEVNIQPQTEKKLNGECMGSGDAIQLHGGIVSIKKSSGEEYPLNFDKQAGELLGYSGSSGNPKVCILALKYAENYVNESYLLFVYDVHLGKFRLSKVKSIINPDFIKDGIASEYTDGPMGRRGKVCYSNKIKDYYFCEKAEQFSDQLEKRQICNELSCAEPEILKQGTSNILAATISEEKVYLLDKKNDSVFNQRKAYLLKGDKVVLNDYYDGGEGLYYQVTYVGKVSTKGWVRKSSIAIGSD